MRPNLLHALVRKTRAKRITLADLEWISREGATDPGSGRTAVSPGTSSPRAKAAKSRATERRRARSTLPDSRSSVPRQVTRYPQGLLQPGGAPTTVSSAKTHWPSNSMKAGRHDGNSGSTNAVLLTDSDGAAPAHGKRPAKARISSNQSAPQITRHAAPPKKP